MKRKCFMAMLVVMAVVVSEQMAFGAGGTADDALRLTLPYVTVGADHYRAVFDFVSTPQDPSGAYWKLVWAGPTSMTGPQGGILDASLNILNTVVMYRGYPFDIDLAFTPIPQDPSGAYWKLSRIQALPVRIDSVGGPDDSCNNFSVLDPTQVQQIIQCMQNCGTNPECLMNCSPDDLGFTFQLAVTFLNESAETLGFKLPPGTVFYPEDSSLQPMMVLHVPELVLPPGLSTRCIPTYCLAEHLSAPFWGSVYTPAAITGLQCLYEIAELTFGKTLTGAALN